MEVQRETCLNARQGRMVMEGTPHHTSDICLNNKMCGAFLAAFRVSYLERLQDQQEAVLKATAVQSPLRQ